MSGAWPVCSRAVGRPARRIGRVLVVLVCTALALGSSAAAATRTDAVVLVPGLTTSRGDIYANAALASFIADGGRHHSPMTVG